MIKQQSQKSGQDSLAGYRFGRPDRYSAKHMTKPVVFICNAPDARDVRLVGDFNDWDEQGQVMQRQPDGAWRTEVMLTHGHHHYRFVVDGHQTLDPFASGVSRDHMGAKVSLLSVS
jgi:1,4-alpha-glucan branching enzyme